MPVQISVKIRDGIAMSIPSLKVSAADEIASKCNVTREAVYRAWQKCRAGKEMRQTPVLLALAELAVSRRKETQSTNKRLAQLEKSFSK